VENCLAVAVPGECALLHLDLARDSVTGFVSDSGNQQNGYLDWRLGFPSDKDIPLRNSRPQQPTTKLRCGGLDFP
jgi:hypothetical protein